MNNPKIYNFDPVIYPYKLWVIITNDIKNVQKYFLNYNKEEIDGDLLNCKGCSIDVVLKEDRNIRGVLITFESKKEMTPGLMAHESYHAAISIWEYIEETNPSEEAFAYLLKWIVECCNKVKNNKF